MAKYKYREGSYGYEEPIGFESIRSMIDDEISDNKKTDAQQSEDIENEGEERRLTRGFLHSKNNLEVLLN